MIRKSYIYLGHCTKGNLQCYHIQAISGITTTKTHCNLYYC